MQISLEDDAPQNGNWIVLKLCGRIAPLDAAEEVDLRSLCGPDIFSRMVVLDLRQADFLGSSGVNWILAQRKAFVDAGGRMAICCTEGSVQDVLRLMRLDRLIPLADSPATIPPV